MSFLVIVAVVGLILGMLNRLSRKSPEINRDNDNVNFFNNSNDFTQNKLIKKEDLFAEIKKNYELGNYRETKFKILEYLKHNNEDSAINLMLVMSLIELNELNEAGKYANNVLHIIEDNKIGYYLIGCVEYVKGNFEKSINLMQSAVKYGLPITDIEDTINDKQFIIRIIGNEFDSYDEFERNNPF